MLIEARFFCNHCGLEFPMGIGGYIYIEVDRDLLKRKLREYKDRIKLLRGYKEIINYFKLRLTSKK